MVKISFCRLKVTYLQLKQRYAILTIVITLEVKKKRRKKGPKFGTKHHHVI